MTPQPASHIEPSKHSTDEVDAFLDMIEDNIDNIPGAGSPAIKPIKEPGDDGKPEADTQPPKST